MSKINLTKSIDEMIDDIFAEKINKSDAPNLDVASQASTTADAAVNQAPKAQKDEARSAGRPEQISSIPQEDEDGKRAGKYDNDIAKKQAEEENEEGKKQADAKRMDQTMGRQEKDAMPMAKALSADEYAEYMEYKKAKAEKKKEKQLKKAFEEQRDLIKSAVREATAGIVKENMELKKSLSETQELVKAMAERPQRRKSIDGIQALEKSQSVEQGPATFSKSEILDAAEEMFFKGQLSDTDVVEIENTGMLFNKEKRQALEKFIANKK